MLLLAIDTATSAVTVALHDGSAVLATSTVLDPRRHTELVAQGIVQVLAESGRRADEVSFVAVGVGPGPFTGLRVGLASARTFSFARGVPVGGVCSLDVLAYQARPGSGPGQDRPLVVATDARRKEVYTARYESAGAGAIALRRVAGPSVEHPEALAASLDGARVVGRGAVLYADVLDPTGVGPVDRDGPMDVDAGALASFAVEILAAGGTLLLPDPMYLRRPDVSPASPRKPVLP